MNNSLNEAKGDKFKLGGNKFHAFSTFRKGYSTRITFTVRFAQYKLGMRMFVLVIAATFRKNQFTEIIQHEPETILQILADY